MPNLWKLLKEKIDAITGANHPLSEDVGAALGHLADLMTQVEQRIARLEQKAVTDRVLAYGGAAGEDMARKENADHTQAQMAMIDAAQGSGTQEATKVEPAQTPPAPIAESEPEAKP